MHYTGTTWWWNTLISPGPIWHHAQCLQYYSLHSLCCTTFITGNLYVLIPSPLKIFETEFLQSFRHVIQPREVENLFGEGSWNAIPGLPFAWTGLLPTARRLQSEHRCPLGTGGGGRLSNGLIQTLPEAGVLTRELAGCTRSESCWLVQLSFLHDGIVPALNTFSGFTIFLWWKLGCGVGARPWCIVSNFVWTLLITLIIFWTSVQRVFSDPRERLVYIGSESRGRDLAVGNSTPGVIQCCCLVTEFNHQLGLSRRAAVSSGQNICLQARVPGFPWAARATERSGSFQWVTVVHAGSYPMEQQRVRRA